MDTLIKKRRLEPAERFLNKVEVVESGCWEWTASRDPHGYGRFGHGHGFGMILAHRYSYALHNGELPDGLLICHTCDNPPCVNPDHLYAGTTRQNQQDVVDRLRNGRGNGSARLLEEDVLAIRETYAGGGVTQEELAATFGVSQPMISQIVRRLCWTHL